MSEDETKEDGASNSEDTALKMLNARRMLELRKRANPAPKPIEAKTAKPPSNREILVKALRDRGDEVLRSAEASYPREMSILVPKLANLVRSKQVSTISGGDLLQFLRSIGLRVSVQTSISVTEHGKTVSLADKLKQERD
ncbi:MAG: hypothetical protein ACRECH_00690 [Nitrososphaerales archaeon]